jgi:hypothetical protein
MPRRRETWLTLAWLFVSPCGMSAGPYAQPRPAELIERTMAIVDTLVITITDVQTAVALGLVEVSPEAGDPVAAATDRLVDRALMLREVERYAPAEPAEARVEQALAEARVRAAARGGIEHVMAAGGFSESRLRSWLRDDLRIASYLSQRFAAAVTPTAEEVARAYARQRNEFDRRQIPAADAAAILEAQLSSERRAALIADWIADLRRRTRIVELWKTQGR